MYSILHNLMYTSLVIFIITFSLLFSTVSVYLTLCFIQRIVNMVKALKKKWGSKE